MGEGVNPLRREQVAASVVALVVVLFAVVAVGWAVLLVSAVF